MEIRTVNVTRYVTPLREGGSLPAIVEADDEFLYVLKFRGAGQGRKALIAELIGGEIARTLGFKVPEIVFALLDAAFGRIEGDEEIPAQHYLKAAAQHAADPFDVVFISLKTTPALILSAFIWVCFRASCTFTISCSPPMAPSRS